MFWRKRESKTGVRTLPAVRFVGEQDGEPERLLKSVLIAELSARPEIERAYLARVEYPDGVHVALCLVAQEDPSLVERVGARFGEIFARPQHLDILFLRPAQEAELQQVCPPFHDGASS